MRLSLTLLACLAILIVTLTSLSTSSQGNVDLEIEVKPLRSRIEGRIIPGDIVEVNVRVVVTPHTMDSVGLGYRVECISGSEHHKVVEGSLRVPLSGGLGSSRFNLEIQWCKQVSITITSPEGTSKTVILDIDPEVSIELPDYYRYKIETMKEGSTIILGVRIKSNVDGARGAIVIRDETLDLKLLEKPITLRSGVYMEEFYLRLPENPVRALVFKEYEMLHKIVVEYVGVDTYNGNNEDSFYVMIVSDNVWRIPWALAIVFGFIVTLVALVYIARIAFS